MKLTDSGNYSYYGLFSELGFGNQPGGAIENIALINLRIKGSGFGAVGGLVGFNIGTVTGSFVSGSVESSGTQCCASIGGLVGSNFGSVAQSGSTASVTGPTTAAYVGGLVGAGFGPISHSWAMCVISGSSESQLGDLTGNASGSAAISESYAEGKVHGGDNSDAGGLVGVSGTAVSASYSTGRIGKFSGGYRGGLIGDDGSPPGSNTATYWDTDTSGIRKLSKGAGYPKNDPGITGLTDQQLLSGLPAGFDPTVWAQSPSINDGYPYLINNPPR